MAVNQTNMQPGFVTVDMVDWACPRCFTPNKLEGQGRDMSQGVLATCRECGEQFIYSIELRLSERRIM